MFDRRLVLLASPKEFPQAQFYAECFSMLFEDMDHRMNRKDYAPSRHDYYKVYIAVKDKKAFEPIISSHVNEFQVEFTNRIPDYRKHEARKIANWLVSKSFIDPLDDVKALAERERKAKALEEAERRGQYAASSDSELHVHIPTFKKRKPNA